MTYTPSYKDFSTKRGVWARFVRLLEPKVPMRVPEELMSRQYSGGRSVASNQLRQAAQNAGFTVSVRTFDGETWVCRLSDEDDR